MQIQFYIYLIRRITFFPGKILSDRTQQTNIDGFLSTTDKITLGVPQGSVLGPILFLLFINDLPNISKLFYTILFADDATLSLVGPDQSY